VNPRGVGGKGGFRIGAKIQKWSGGSRSGAEKSRVARHGWGLCNPSTKQIESKLDSLVVQKPKVK